MPRWQEDIGNIPASRAAERTVMPGPHSTTWPVLVKLTRKVWVDAPVYVARLSVEIVKFSARDDVVDDAVETFT